jgi:hypothetical protein
MSIETLVRLTDQIGIKAPLTNTRFIAGNQQDRLASYVERKGQSPLAVHRCETQLFHIRVPGAIQCIYSRPAQLRPELLQEPRQSQDLQLYILMQPVELQLKLTAHFNDPAHVTPIVWHEIHMLLKTCLSANRQFCAASESANEALAATTRIRV